MHNSNPWRSCVEIYAYYAPKQWLAAAHFATSIAGWSPLPARQKLQQLCFVPHFFSQSWRAGRHFESFWHYAYCDGHFYYMHCWGSLNDTNELAFCSILKVKVSTRSVHSSNCFFIIEIYYYLIKNEKCLKYVFNE